MSDGKEIPELTVAELRARAAELEITGRGSMNKDDLVQAVLDAEAQLGEMRADAPADAAAPAAEPATPPAGATSAEPGETPTSQAAQTAEPSAVVERDAPQEKPEHLGRSDVDAMGLDKRRAVVGKKYGASAAKQATVYGIFLAVVAALLIGGKLAADELDQGPEVDPDVAPWSQADARQRPPGDLDFPPSVSP